MYYSTTKLSRYQEPKL